MNSEITPQQLRRILESVPYRFAYTYRKFCPHWYTLREAWNDDPLFDLVVQTIRDIGEVRPWPAPPKEPKYHNAYFDAGNWTYWSMGAPIPETILINRARRYDSKPPKLFNVVFL